LHLNSFSRFSLDSSLHPNADLKLLLINDSVDTSSTSNAHARYVHNPSPGIAVAKHCHIAKAFGRKSVLTKLEAEAQRNWARTLLIEYDAIRQYIQKMQGNKKGYHSRKRLLWRNIFRKTLILARQMQSYEMHAA
jgi:hypothetical protein